MGCKSSTESSTTAAQYPSFKVWGKNPEEWHSCLEQGCFKRPGGKTVDVDLKCAVISNSWLFLDEHRNALKDALMDRHCEVMMDVIVELVKHNDKFVEKYYAAVRKGLFYPCLRVCPVWLANQPIPLTVMGLSGCGKTCIVNRWHNGKWRSYPNPVLEEDLYEHLPLMDGSIADTHILDTTGDSTYEDWRSEWMRKAEEGILLLCAEIRNVDKMIEDFDHFLDLYQIVRDDEHTFAERPTEAISWGKENGVAVVLVGTQVDGHPYDRESRVRELKDHYHLPYIECSAKLPANLDWLVTTAVYELWLTQMYFKKTMSLQSF